MTNPTYPTKPTIIAVVGPSGSGKTTAVEYAHNNFGIPVVRSYTTRPPRPNETQGVDHIFVSETEMPPRSMMLAYTRFGGYHYWATRQQVDCVSNILYVIDEDGLVTLLNNYNKVYDIVPLYIKRDDLSSIKDKKRLKRDLERTVLPVDTYYKVIDNNGTMYDFLIDFCNTVKEVIQNKDSISSFCNNSSGLDNNY